MPSFKKEKTAFQSMADRALGAPEEIRARRTAAEETYQNVLNRLGAPGTYETVGGTAAQNAGNLAGNDGTGGDGILKKSTVYKGAVTNTEATTLDPKKAAESAVNSAQGRIVSRLTAEAEQTVAREGALYDEMIRNTQLPIIESSAQLARQNAEQFKRMAAKGGAARRQAFEAVGQIREQERINSMRMSQLAETRNKIDVWARDNAQSVVKFGQNWAANLGGIREDYQSAMDQATEFMVDKSLPLAMTGVQNIKQIRQQAHAEKRAKTEAWIKGIVGVAAIALGGVGAMGLLGMAGAAGGAAAGTGAASLAGGGVAATAVPGVSAASGGGLLSSLGQAIGANSGAIANSGVTLLGESLSRGK